MNACEFESRSSDAPAAMVWGFAKIDALRAAPARLRCEVDSDSVAGVTIIGAGGESAANGSTVHVTMFRLPGGDAAFVHELKSIAACEKHWPLADGRAFEQHMLAPLNLPAHWRHKAAQFAADSRGIVHAYRGKSRAMIVRYELRKGDVLHDELFNWAMKNISVIDGAWLLDPPLSPAEPAAAPVHPEPQGFHVELQDAPSMARVPASSDVRERPLTEDEMKPLTAKVAEAIERLQLSKHPSPKETLDAIHVRIERLRPKFASLMPNMRQNYATWLGSLWGQSLREVMNWEWCYLTGGEGEAVLVIVSPDRAYCIAPVAFMTRALEQPDPDAPDNVRLLFNTIVERNLAPSKPRAYLMLA